MIRKLGPGLYQIACLGWLYRLTRDGRRGWVATAPEKKGYRRTFPSIAAAYLQLTGEPLDRKRFAKISKGVEP